jgi:uncharacterized protein YbbC (DUF1343 family)
MLLNVDVLLFDMQDVGARFYTYNTTLGLVLEAAAASGKPVWVLDRPNPAGGDYVAGWILEEQYESFIGAYPIPMAHGMTLGELAQMMIGERWIDFEQEPELRVISARGWTRSMKWPETGLTWVPPSPNLPTFEHAYAYLGTVLFEGTSLSEGRGTDDPFLTVGSPATGVDSSWISRLEAAFPAMEIEPIAFTPRSIPGKALRPKHEGEQCRGVSLSISDYKMLGPVAFGVKLLEAMLNSTPGAQTLDYLYKLAGSQAVDSFEVSWQDEVQEFRQARTPYLLYD